MAGEGRDILDYWFGGACATPAAIAARMSFWFSSQAEVDREIEARFGDLVRRAASGSLGEWSPTADGRLAHILLLDQFPRNLYRGSPRAFATDERALAEAIDAIAEGLDRELGPAQRAFLYMPFQHAEDQEVQRESVRLYTSLVRDAPENLRPQLAEFRTYARRHAAVIARFGRFPHRNAVLGRTSSDEERTYLDRGGETFGA